MKYFIVASLQLTVAGSSPQYQDDQDDKAIDKRLVIQFIMVIVTMMLMHGQ